MENIKIIYTVQTENWKVESESYYNILSFQLNAIFNKYLSLANLVHQTNMVGVKLLQFRQFLLFQCINNSAGHANENTLQINLY